jgi:hypothetical protein
MTHREQYTPGPARGAQVRKDGEMTTGTSKVTIHMVASLDFFIARKDGSVSWLEWSDRYENGVAEEDVEEFLKTIDCFGWPSRRFFWVTERDFSTTSDKSSHYT